MWKRKANNEEETVQEFYVDSNDSKVVGPREYFQFERTIVNFGPGSFSLAIGSWSEKEIGLEGRVLAIRWNGASESNSFGRPAQGETGQWFPIPQELWDKVLEGAGVKLYDEGRRELGLKS